MRIVLVLLAMIGLLTSPAVAAAAQASCHHDDVKAMSMPMAEMPGMTHVVGQKADPCCDPASRHDQGKTKHDGLSCLQACAASCGVAAALPSTPMALLARPDVGAPEATRLASLKPHEPGGLERPPKSID